MKRSSIFVAVVSLAALLAGLFLARRSPVTAEETPEEEVDIPVFEQPAPVPPPPAGTSRRLLLAGAVGFVAAVAVLAYAILASDGGGETPVVTVQATSTATPQGTDGIAAGPVATPVAEAQPAGTDVARILIPSLEIDAPIVALGVDVDGTMQAPDSPSDVAWYNFSARPGELSNVVMAGHLDYVDYGPAVFFRLKEAQPGDEVRLELVDGTFALYRVVNVTSYVEATAPVLDIVGPTDSEIVTLITCGGSFDPASQEYDKRVVLRAERIVDSAVNN